MDDNGSDIIWVGLERGDLFRSVVVVDSQLEIVRAAYDPVLPGDEAPCSYGYICEFEGLDDCLAFVRASSLLRLSRLTCVSYDQM